MKKISLLIFLLWNVSFLYSQDLQKIDSLKQFIKESQNDTLIMQAYLVWDEDIYSRFTDSSVTVNNYVVLHADSILAINKITDSITLNTIKTKLGTALNNMGSAYNKLGNTKDALAAHRRSLEIKKQIGYEKGMAYSYNNIGHIYSGQANIPLALEYFHKSLKIREKINDKIGVAGSMINLGIIYYHQKNTDQALEYFLTSIDILKEIGDNRRIAFSYLNIGHIYTDQDKTKQALEYFEKSLEIYKSSNHRKGIADVYNNMGAIYLKEKGNHKALIYFTDALEIYLKIDRKLGIIRTQNNIAIYYFGIKDYTKSIKYSSKSLKTANELGLKLEIKEASANLYKSYEAIGKDKDALKMYQQYIEVKDSLLSEDNLKESIRQKFKYSYEKQAATDSIQAAEQQKVSDAKIEAQKAQISQERTKRFALYGGLALMIFFGAFMYHRYRITQKQKVIIEHQKDEVEEKNREILDSIKYAKRIQSAILPAPQVVKEYLKESFILYKPKDIVAGDFYWMEQKGNQVLFAAADCTGHGVPGAMVSVVCNNGLNRAVREYGLLDPGKILDKTREIVVQEFEKSDEDVQDGMDLALCSIKENTLQYAGAHNPLWIIRDNEILITKANKQPIGKYDNPKPYLTHTFELQKGDIIYIFSDGYVDQFGGPSGKKFMVKAFKKLLLKIKGLPMVDQKDLLDKSFESWKGELDQVDDVCIIGVKF